MCAVPLLFLFFAFQTLITIMLFTGRHFRNDSRIDVSGVRFCRWGPVDQVSTNAFAKNSVSLATSIVHLAGGFDYIIFIELKDVPSC